MDKELAKRTREAERSLKSSGEKIIKQHYPKLLEKMKEVKLRHTDVDWSGIELELSIFACRMETGIDKEIGRRMHELGYRGGHG